MWLLLLFVVLPAVELYLLVRLGALLGVMPTIGLILATGMVGWMLVRSQGISTMRRIREETAQGRLPALEMVSGLCLLGAGLLLITPGFVTDVLGFMMLVPPMRRVVARRLMGRFRMTVATAGGMHGPREYSGSSPGGPRRERGGGVVIDVPATHVQTVDTDEADRSTRGAGTAGGPGLAGAVLEHETPASDDR